MGNKESVTIRFKYDNEKKIFEVREENSESHYILSYDKIKSMRNNNNFYNAQNQIMFFQN